MTGEILGEITLMPSTLSDDRVTMIFNVRTGDETRLVMYSAPLNDQGQPPYLEQGQQVELADAVLNIHPRGDFYFAHQCRVTD